MEVDLLFLSRHTFYSKSCSFLQFALFCPKLELLYLSYVDTDFIVSVQEYSRLS